jgi:hypothetical protein
MGQILLALREKDIDQQFNSGKAKRILKQSSAKYGIEQKLYILFCFFFVFV